MMDQHKKKKIRFSLISVKNNIPSSLYMLYVNVEIKSKTEFFFFANCLQRILLILLASMSESLFVYNITKTTALVVMQCLGSIRTVTRKN